MYERPTKRRGPLLWLAGKPWWFWIVATILAPILYFASFGPACWATAQSTQSPIQKPPRWMLIYFPLGQLTEPGQSMALEVTMEWARLGMCEETHVAVPTNAYGRWGVWSK